MFWNHCAKKISEHKQITNYKAFCEGCVTSFFDLEDVKRNSTLPGKMLFSHVFVLQLFCVYLSFLERQPPQANVIPNNFHI